MSLFDHIDAFADIRKQEAEAVAGFRNAIAGIDAELAVVIRARGLENLPGFQQYQQSLQQLLDRATTDLVTTTRSSDYLRWQQGRVQALRDVLTILRGGDLLSEQLTQRRAVLAERLQELLKVTPRQREVSNVQGQ